MRAFRSTGLSTCRQSKPCSLALDTICRGESHRGRGGGKSVLVALAPERGVVLVLRVLARVAELTLAVEEAAVFETVAGRASDEPV